LHFISLKVDKYQQGSYTQTVAKITIQNHKKSAEIPDGELTILQAGEKAGVDMEFGCRDCSCGTCVVEVVSGMENLSPATAEEIDVLDTWNRDPEKYRLTCCTKVMKGEVVVTEPAH
jgi:ferredoxin